MITNEVDGNDRPSLFRNWRLAVKKSLWCIHFLGWVFHYEDQFQSNHNFQAQNHKGSHILKEESNKIIESSMKRSWRQAQLPLTPAALCANPRGVIRGPQARSCKIEVFRARSDLLYGAWQQQFYSNLCLDISTKHSNSKAEAQEQNVMPQVYVTLYVSSTQVVPSFWERDVSTLFKQVNKVSDSSYINEFTL